MGSLPSNKIVPVSSCPNDVITLSTSSMMIHGRSDSDPEDVKIACVAAGSAKTVVVRVSVTIPRASVGLFVSNRTVSVNSTPDCVVKLSASETIIQGRSDSDSECSKINGSNSSSSGSSSIGMVLESVSVCASVTIAIMIVGYRESSRDSVSIEVSTKIWGWNAGMVSSLSISSASDSVELALGIGLGSPGITVTAVAICPFSGHGFEQIGVVESTGDVSNSVMLKLELSDKTVVVYPFSGQELE